MPDFYLPDADAYLEHWAVNAKGEAPAEFAGYKGGMAWKRQVHAENGTRLLETTMADLWSGQLFSKLESQLTALGVKLDPNPDRPAPGRQPIESPRLVRTIRAFLTHVKNNRLTMEELRSRLDTGVAGTFRFRHQMFLGLFEKLWDRWEARLRAERVIDFEDMLNMAADCLERGQWQNPYELVMVDEFQDASQARARLVAALVSKPGRYLFAVGDDWQSINRFAGADLGVMSEFEKHFGKAVTLKLETTFRCPQSLCDITGKFIQQNARQLRKAVRSPMEQVVDPIRIVRVANEQQTKSAIETVISRLIESHAGGKQSVYVLGRYKRDRTHMPTHYSMYGVDLQFMTVHSAKGLEADHIIIPGLSSDTMGFPCRIVDDPVLALAMPGEDSHEFAEERRLFYVGLTRARKTVTLITIERKESTFVSELIRDHGIKVLNVDGDESDAELCSSCRVGFLVPRKGKWGPFMGCSHYPRCKFTRRLAR
ncbi:UvrD-helicase domain-containing protein [Roseateles sp. LYH14W]|uniref:DNA 3'-5' helicase n=1 Tax=Pelomonas parva TaxID=3299032 RepID=A0ABW7FAB4_9BURK